jgi:outer membrane biosynthesis protein TonB
MNRLHKKCLIASSGLHGFLLLLVLFGSAFFVAKEKQINNPKLRFVPSKFVEEALAGGGGNPKIAQTDDVQKGSPQAPAQVTPAPPPPPPKQEVKKAEPKKPDPPAPTPKPVKPVEVAKTKPPENTPPTKPRIDLSDLKPIARTDTDKRKAEQEAEAQEAARRRALATAVANAANAQRQKVAQQIGKATETMQRGFSSGTKVDVGGPGGEAYASYGALVQQVYADAWTVLQDMTDDDSVAVVRVTIARDGRVLEARFVRRSDNSTMNKSVQRALDSVKQIGRPFPDFIKDLERSFTIEFNLKAKRLTG